MTNTREILEKVGTFTSWEVEEFERHVKYRVLQKNETLLQEGEVCKAFFYLLKGSIYQFKQEEISEVVIDLHLHNEWVFNQQSLIDQSPSSTTIKAYCKAEVLELTLEKFHELCGLQQSFLQFAKILNPAFQRTHIFDNSLNPVERYDFIKKSKPNLVTSFPVKMIASYLKIAPETLSRVRAKP
ncbi:Crp/Fnr family transcriptional regulator [Pedobacter insulae]|uniref:cAMP-binding domain of CRP or a regulatory subunit of cAMP-dependent protein kinases n=1 Tax=Pedobacter insulae TaxID=414048 RepID=A0A1I2WX98_9SPHI|nr:Crp/Fnr family transcriptional regulator [Pedobacter insulae]SFH05928.1 cAMP-binding domain of CRP or a regulatory subunit of cAMP-dependent protein kinases [Pedobacter insulae]